MSLTPEVSFTLIYPHMFSVGLLYFPCHYFLSLTRTLKSPSCGLSVGPILCHDDFALRHHVSNSLLCFVLPDRYHLWRMKNEKGGTILFCLFFTLEGICWGSTNPGASSILGTYLMTELYSRNIYSLKTTKNFEDFSLCGVLLFYNSSF